MALNTVNTILATIQTRHGIELDFDADQMTVGEWSLSTDKKIVRICIMPGLCIRMATYEAFEEDMVEVQRILTECQDIHVAVNEIADLVEQHKDAALESAFMAKESEKAAKISEEKSRTSEINSKASETAAGSYKNTAMEEAEKSRTFSENAEISAQISSQKSLEASASSLAAKESETEAKKSEEGAFASKEDSEDFSLLSESWAKGETGVRIGEDTNNSRYFSDLANVLVSEAQKLLDQAQKIVSAATNGALIPAGTVSFADLPESPMVGYLYNISDDFTTDSRFAEGSGIYYRAGANVYWTSDEKWDVMIGTQVTGVKGENEDTYHVGNVNITKSSLGLGNVGDYKSVSVEPQNLTSSEKKNGRDNIGAIAMDGNSSDTTVEFEKSNERTELLSGETISSLFGKTKKWISDLPGAKVVGFIETLTDFNQIDSSFRYWHINTIDADYAQETGIERNVGDFYVLILSHNGNSVFAFKFGNCILNSPRLGNDYYLVQMWNGSPIVTYHRANVPALTNNLLATNPGTALDAAQGKVLDGKTSKLYMQTTVNSIAPTERFLKKGDDLNTYISPGTYYANGGDITETLTNKPAGLSGGFRLDIIETAGGGWLVQRIMDHNFPPNVFLRSKEGEYGLSNWVKLATNEQIAQINSDLQKNTTSIRNIDKQLDSGRVSFKWNDSEGLEVRIDNTYVGKVTLR